MSGIPILPAAGLPVLAEYWRQEGSRPGDYYYFFPDRSGRSEENQIGSDLFGYWCLNLEEHTMRLAMSRASKSTGGQAERQRNNRTQQRNTTHPAGIGDSA